MLPAACRVLLPWPGARVVAVAGVWSGAPPLRSPVARPQPTPGAIALAWLRARGAPDALSALTAHPTALTAEVHFRRTDAYWLVLCHHGARLLCAVAVLPRRTQMAGPWQAHRALVAVPSEFLTDGACLYAVWLTVDGLRAPAIQAAGSSLAAGCWGQVPPARRSEVRVWRWGARGARSKNGRPRAGRPVRRRGPAPGARRGGRAARSGGRRSGVAGCPAGHGGRGCECGGALPPSAERRGGNGRPWLASLCGRHRRASRQDALPRAQATDARLSPTRAAQAARRPPFPA